MRYSMYEQYAVLKDIIARRERLIVRYEARMMTDPVLLAPQLAYQRALLADDRAKLSALEAADD